MSLVVAVVQPLTLPPLPALDGERAELARLSELVRERRAALTVAEEAALAAGYADAAERVTAIREQREPAAPTAPAAEAARERAGQESLDAQAALDQAVEEIGARLRDGAPELLEALEKDRAAARRKLSQKLTGAREALQAFAEVEHAAAWLEMVGGGRLRPFTDPKPLLTPAQGPHGYLTSVQAIDALDALAAGELPEGGVRSRARCGWPADARAPRAELGFRRRLPARHGRPQGALLQLAAAGRA